MANDVRAALAAAGYSPERITVHHLLTHSSGLRDHAGRSTNYADTVMHDPAHVWTHAEQVAACMALGGPLSEPGTHFAYSDTGYLILGDILERVAGQPLHALMRQRLHFEGLGLVQTHFERHETTPVGQVRAGQTIGDIDVASIDCSCDLSGGGGLISTTGELATWFRAAALGELFDTPQTQSLALSTPSLLFTPPDVLHSALMRGRAVGIEPSWMHGGAWGLAAGYCPGSDIAWALSFNQIHAGVSTVGVPGDPQQPSLADRLLTPVQRAVHALL
jgi:D-alanyl-D-alanine carboxypeptidase